MANTYSKIYVHIIFSVKGRENLIGKRHREELHKYITGIMTKRGQKLLAIFAMPDHVHQLVGIKPNISISDLARDIKAGSSKFITEKKWLQGKFRWQEGFGVFSYSRNELDRVIKYILNQEEHHKINTFKEEYVNLLDESDINYNDEYLFNWIDVGKQDVVPI
jgi:REP-associated tyrosine transposase